MARVRRSYEVAIDHDRRILHPGCTGCFSVGLHDEFGVRRAVIEPRHAAASDNLRAGCQHRTSADAGDDSAASADVLYELGYARIFGKQGRAFCTTWNEDAHIVLGPGFRYRTLDIQQAGSREIAVNLHRLLARGYHLDLVTSFIEGDLGKEVFLLLKGISDEGSNLWALVGHCVVSFGVCVGCEKFVPASLECRRPTWPSPAVSRSGGRGRSTSFFSPIVSLARRPPTARRPPLAASHSSRAGIVCGHRELGRLFLDGLQERPRSVDRWTISVGVLRLGDKTGVKRRCAPAVAGSLGRLRGAIKGPEAAGLISEVRFESLQRLLRSIARQQHLSKQ